MIFKWSSISCDFIEAYKLSKTTNDPNAIQSSGIKINTIATIKDKSGSDINLEFVKDTNIYSPNSEFININPL
jgi:hypothetical protein